MFGRIRRWSGRLACLGVLGALLAPGVSTGAVAGPDSSERPHLHKIDPQLLETLEARSGRPKDRVEVMVVMRSRPKMSTLRGNPRAVEAELRRTARNSQGPVAAEVRRRGGEVVNTFWLDNMVLARVTPKAVESLAALDSVERVIPNFRIEVPPAPAAEVAPAAEGGPTWGLEKIGADVVQGVYGTAGEDVRVAVLDTGVDVEHPDLDGKLITADPSDPSYPGGWMEFSRTGEPIASLPRDTHYHGTHVAGTVLGGDVSGTQIGVAPAADLMAGLVLPGGNGSFAQVIAGMQWAVSPFDAEGNPAGDPADVVNMSLAVVGHFGALVEPVRNMHLAGVFPAVAIGNHCGGGSGGPGNVYEATAVGATDASDGVADFSCGEEVARSDWPNPPAEWPSSYVVPDVSAPGVGIYSAMPGGEYGLLDGTSMATPHVSGTVALMFNGDPGISVDEALQTLIETSTFDDRYGSERPNPRYGWGRIDAYRAFSAVAFDSGIVGTVTDAATGEPIAGAQITHVDVGRDVVADQDGEYELRVPPGTYDLKISGFGYESRTVTDIAVEGDQFPVVDVELAPLPSGKISGTVTYAATGSTIPGAHVELLGVGAERSDTTAVNGAYTIERVPDGTYDVVASAPGLPRSEVATVTVTAGRTARRTDLALPRPIPTARISTHADGTQGDGESLVPSLSADGDIVAYYSFATNLVDGDANGQGDVFIYDRQSGGTERISVSPDGTDGNGTSVRPALSADGRFVAYSSSASNLVSGDTNGQGDIFVHDRQTGTTELASLTSDGAQSNRASFVPSLSADGRYVAFYSFATNLVQGDTNGQADIFVHDRQTGATERVSVASDGAQSNSGSFVPSLSADGRHVIFESFASNLVDGDTNGEGDVFVHDRATGTTERVSVGSDGEEADDNSQGGSISADGRYAVFYSSASTLVEGDANELDDVFVRDRQTGTTERISLAPGGVEGNGSSQGTPKVGISADGRFLAYQSTASNLVPGDTNGRADVFVHDRQAGTTERVSLAPDGSQGDGPSQSATLDAEGDTVAFHSRASTLAEGDTNRETDVFVHDQRLQGPEPWFALADLRVSPTEPRAGEPVTVTAQVKNVGDQAGSYDAVLRIDGDPAQSTVVQLEPGTQTRIDLTITLDEAGTYALAIGPLSAQLTVR